MMVGGFQKWLKVRRSKKKIWIFYSEGILTFGGAQLNHQKGLESHPEGKIFKKEIFNTERWNPFNLFILKSMKEVSNYFGWWWGA